MTRGSPSGNPRHQAVLSTLILHPLEGINLPGSGKMRALAESAPWVSGCFLRTQQRAHPARRSVRSFRCPAEAGSVLAAPSRASRVNSQCSTRKHGRPATQTVTKGANAP